MGINSKNILITGAGGTIGKYITDYLLNNSEYNLILNYYNDGEVPKNISSKAKIVIGDIAKVLDECFESADTVIHLASNVNPDAYKKSFEEAFIYGASATFSIIDYLKHFSKPIHILFPSSGGTVYSGKIPEGGYSETDEAYGVSPYGVQKIMFENYLRLLCSINKNTTCNILRISNPYAMDVGHHKKQGFIDVTINKIMNGETLEIWSPLDTTRDYLHISDLCIAIHSAIEYKNGYEIINIGSGTGTSLKDVLNIISGFINRKIDYCLEEAQTFYPNCSILNIEKASKILDWKPVIKVQDGIKKIIENYNISEK